MRSSPRHSGTSVANAAVEHDDPCWFFFTSGTTGRSKAAVLTHGQMAFVITNHLCRSRAGLDRGRRLAGGGAALAWRGRAPARALGARRDRRSCCRPSVSISTRPIRLIATLPDHQYLHRADDPEDAGRASRGRPARSFQPALHHLCRRADVSRGPEGGARQARQGDRAVFRAGRSHRQHHRAAAGAASSPRTARMPASAPAASSARACRCRSRTMTATSCRRRQQGEICVIGPAVFAGYYDNPEANAKAFRDGWFRTGDLGHMDEQGFVYITGRASDMYISGGSNIYPREIEEKILTHPAIAEVAVLGVPDPVWGEIGVAVCVTRAGRQGQRGRDRRIPVGEDRALQDAQALLLLGGAAEIRLWQGAQAAGPRRTGSAWRTRLATGSRHREAHRSSPAPAAPERVEWVESAWPALRAGAAGRPAAGRGSPAWLCRGGFHQRRGAGRRRRARALRLCHAGAVEDAGACRLLQRDLPACRDRPDRDRGDELRLA